MGDASAFDWTSRRILIVDRDEQFRFFARGLFSHHRVREVQSIAHVTEIPRVLARHEIHVAFVELTHEETGVAHMLQWLRNDKDSPAPGLPVILLTKTLDKAQLARVGVFGIHGILQKPVSGEKMLKAVIGMATNPRMFKTAGESVATVAGLPKSQGLSFEARPLSSLRSDGVPSMAPAAGRTPAIPPNPRMAVRPTGKGSETLTKPAQAGAGCIEPAGEAPAPPPRFSVPIEVAETPLLPGSREWPDEPPTARPQSSPLEVVGISEAKPVAAAPAFAEAVLPSKRKEAAEESGPSIADILEAHARWVHDGGRDGRRANLEGRDLCGLALAGVVLTSAMLRRAVLSGCDFTGAEMHGVDLRNAEVLGGTFVGANLAVARMRHARLCGCLFAQASLRGADLGGVDLTEAKLGDADLAGAILLGARLAGADLSAVSGLTQGQLEGVEGDARTRLPPGLFLPRPDDGGKPKAGSGVR